MTTAGINRTFTSGPECAKHCLWIGRSPFPRCASPQDASNRCDTEPPRRDGRAVDGSGLENRRSRKATVGSNPTPPPFGGWRNADGVGFGPSHASRRVSARIPLERFAGWSPLRGRHRRSRGSVGTWALLRAFRPLSRLASSGIQCPPDPRRRSRDSVGMGAFAGRLTRSRVLGPNSPALAIHSRGSKLRTWALQHGRLQPAPRARLGIQALLLAIIIQCGGVGLRRIRSRTSTVAWEGTRARRSAPDSGIRWLELGATLVIKHRGTLSRGSS